MCAHAIFLTYSIMLNYAKMYIKMLSPLSVLCGECISLIHSNLPIDREYRSLPSHFSPTAVHRPLLHVLVQILHLFEEEGWAAVMQFTVEHGWQGYCILMRERGREKTLESIMNINLTLYAVSGSFNMHPLRHVRGSRQLIEWSSVKSITSTKRNKSHKWTQYRWVCSAVNWWNLINHCRSDNFKVIHLFFSLL